MDPRTLKNPSIASDCNRRKCAFGAKNHGLEVVCNQDLYSCFVLGSLNLLFSNLISVTSESVTETRSKPRYRERKPGLYRTDRYGSDDRKKITVRISILHYNFG